MPETLVNFDHFLGDKGKDKCKHKSENSPGRKATNWKGPAMDHWCGYQGECEVRPSQAKWVALYRVLRIAGCCPVGCDLTTPLHLAVIFTCSGHLVCVVSLVLEPWGRSSGWDGLDVQHCAMVTHPPSSLTISPGWERQGSPGKLSIPSMAWCTVGTQSIWPNGKYLPDKNDISVGHMLGKYSLAFPLPFRLNTIPA